LASVFEGVLSSLHKNIFKRLRVSEFIGFYGTGGFEAGGDSIADYETDAAPEVEAVDAEAFFLGVTSIPAALFSAAVILFLGVGFFGVLTCLSLFLIALPLPHIGPLSSTGGDTPPLAPAGALE
jgi:hypothetical protein